MTADASPLMSGTVPTAPRAARQRQGGLLRGTLRSHLGKLGLLLVLVTVGIAVIGPFATPQDPEAIVGPPFATPGAGYPLGTDYLGRDVLSRFLDGGSLILVLAFLATTSGVVVGTALGLLSGYLRGITGQVVMRSLDVLLSFPPILLALVFMSILGPKPWLILLTVASTHVPPVARVVESATLGLTSRGFVQYAEMIGVPRLRILTRQLLANMVAPVMVQFGIRMAYSIGFIGALAYLGYGRRPPAADWGSMVQENQINLISTPLPVLAPVLALALATIGVNLLTDAFGRAAGVDLAKEGQA
ncbi:ABC transporter permease [Pimelobacter simplex]|uniref:ABC transporter permease n=1 Tax=Nocardioides simplex TaxID=2045 RepID=UPI00214FFC1A|nr:ABC transporter permease [Pimelobacter simplex]UUW91441.1 ABC transporter permease [Pimelobacter simplex]UUW95269.1 ABC transporter permease [Pimelobacter simplex]